MMTKTSKCGWFWVVSVITCRWSLTPRLRLPIHLPCGYLVSFSIFLAIYQCNFLEKSVELHPKR